MLLSSAKLWSDLPWQPYKCNDDFSATSYNMTIDALVVDMLRLVQWCDSWHTGRDGYSEDRLDGGAQPPTAHPLGALAL